MAVIDRLIKEIRASSREEQLRLRGVLEEENEMRFERITVEPNQMNGGPCVRGLRSPVATIVGMAAEGMRRQEILEAYPDLEAEDIRGCLEYAAEAVRERALPLLVPA